MELSEEGELIFFAESTISVLVKTRIPQFGQKTLSSGILHLQWQHVIIEHILFYCRNIVNGASWSNC